MREAIANLIDSLSSRAGQRPAALGIGVPGLIDLRTGQESGSIQEVMDGDLDPFIEAKLRGKVRVKGAKDEED